MELTQQDYEERLARRAAGQNDDEDNRLIEHYEANGFSTRDDSAGKAQGATGDDPRPVDDGVDTEVKTSGSKASKSTGRTTR